jgi:hypothetical protein
VIEVESVTVYVVAIEKDWIGENEIMLEYGNDNNPSIDGVIVNPCLALAVSRAVLK